MRKKKEKKGRKINRKIIINNVVSNRTGTSPFDGGGVNSRHVTSMEIIAPNWRRHVCVLTVILLHIIFLRSSIRKYRVYIFAVALFSTLFLMNAVRIIIRVYLITIIRQIKLLNNNPS